MTASTSPKPAPSSAELRIGGLARLSTCDWPGELVATVFCQGCPWTCGYCHNPHLLPARGQDQLAWQDVVAFLETRRGLLDGVVFSGGEPTLQAGLPSAIAAVRALGFRVGLHTAGPYPERLARVLPLLDWIGFDVKAPFAEYDRITGVAGSGDSARASLELVLAHGVECDLRTTVHPDLLDQPALDRLSADLFALGAGRTRIQSFRDTGAKISIPPTTNAA
ncbi:anaerobic ribonucleoside-triphosphate reductase activating protein [Rhodopseudomonas palustris]|uniref:Anaerobic ribonucleoside-triphosphate reductase activating protein n=1 Tax=Rhodopseudomonas palustris TaxID=1076 RepID=A0A323UN07_RHOPL|nr:anaerobic ribonucleoside-triphosphate reductase activating protein [Rhodopseudomonas palustris]PZA13759.1 anaerobic ribonucleoside-triphosphate reductase activating protein [Rhodopseudomonas palustris]